VNLFFFIVNLILVESTRLDITVTEKFDLCSLL